MSTVTDSPLTPIAQQIAEKRYLRKDKDGNCIEDWNGLAWRVVKYVCANENEEYQKRMHELIYNTRFLPNSPCLVNAGTPVGGLLACQPGWARVNTSRGLVRIEDVVKLKRTWSIPTFWGDAKIVKKWSNGIKEVFRFQCKQGHILDCTLDHKVLVVKGYSRKKGLTSDALLKDHAQWIEAKDIETGDALVVDFSEKPFSQHYMTHYECQHYDNGVFLSDDDPVAQDYKNGIKLDEDLARILAYTKCNGNLSYKNCGQRYDTMVLEIITDSEDVLNSLRKSSHISSNEISIDKLDDHLIRVRAYGEKYHSLLRFGSFCADNCDVPHGIFESPKKVIREFLRASFECAGLILVSLSSKTGMRSGRILFGMTSESYVRDTQRLLNMFGIPSSVSGPIIDHSTDNKRYYLSITDDINMKKFDEQIGFISSQKNGLLGAYIKTVNIPQEDEHVSFTEVQSIASLGQHEVYDISTTNETYLNEGIVVHNCFVTKSPEDSWEGFIENKANFGHVARRGGGCGVDFSNIRPEGDPVFGSTHAKACGPIQHMRTVSEDMASITQAGFRGMANMGTLRVTHPDIEKFIVCKQREFALKCLLKEDIFNQYDDIINNLEEQASIILDKFMSNFNISVVATDEFMRAVENDDTFDLTFNGKVYKTINAKELFRTIAYNAWQNGDPGLLFYEAMNSGPYKYSGQELTATNPCGEQMLPQYGSCNLGSIDVSKFYDDSTRDVDWNALRDTIHDCVQFLDNVIDINKFPTADFEKWAKENRPVGLGIMGWADLLLKKRIAYGSPRSLEFARELGKFFADEAHKKSVQLAKERGTPKACRYDELDHRRNITTISIAPTGSISLLAGCNGSIEPIFSPTIWIYNNTGSYQIPHPQADKSYFRCALDDEGKGREVSWQQHVDMQAVFQEHCDSGISKCITGDSLIITKNGLVRIQDLDNNRLEDTFSDLGVKVWSEKNFRDAAEFYYGGLRNTIRVETQNGLVIEGTANHRIKAMLPNGKVDFIRLDQLTTDHYCPVQFNTQKFGNIVTLPSFDIDKNAQSINIPTTLNENVAYLLGFITAEGYYQGNISVILTHSDSDILQEADYLFQKEFGITGTISLENRTEPVYKLQVNSQPLVRWLQSVAQINREACNKIVPDIILRTIPRNIWAFLSGLFLGGFVSASSKGARFRIYLDSERIIRDLQVLLMNFGVMSNIVKKKHQKYDKYFYELLVCNSGLEIIKRNVVFKEQWKKQLLHEFSCQNADEYHLGYPTYVTNILSDVVASSDKSMHQFIKSTKNYRARSAIVSNSEMNVADIEQVLQFFYDDNKCNTELSEKVRNIRHSLKAFSNCIYQRIVKIERSQNEIFDIHVPSNNTFYANGFINHNTINMPNDCKVEDVEKAYMRAWKSGCKGITIYRDGSKTTQVLNTKSKSSGTVGGNNAPKRPKKVPCDIFKTRADGFDWHVIVGKVDNNPYEVFAVNGRIELPDKAFVVKKRKRHYALIDEDGNTLIDNLNEEEKRIHPKVSLETRRFSLELRHGIHPKYIVEQIDKSHEVITSFSKACGRIMKNKYMDSCIVSEAICPNCASSGKQTPLISEAGCWRCKENCGYSKCG